MGSSMGSAIPVVSMDIRQKSVGVVVKHHAPTGASLISRLYYDRIRNKKKIKSLVLVLVECFEFLIKWFSLGVSVW